MYHSLTPITEKKYEQLDVKIFPDRQTMGQAAASDVADKISSLLKKKETIRMIFAAAPSQADFLDALTYYTDIDWGRVIAFHMDEYIGLNSGALQTFGNFLRQYIFDKLPFRQVHYIDPLTPDAESECMRYSELIDEFPIDIICLGIGENGHIAFNDPPIADFNDPEIVKIVNLDKKCRQQQVNDGCFATFSDVPTSAISITIPVFLAAQSLFIVVPGESKADAVYHTLHGEINTDCPATILKSHADATLFLDRDSAGLL